MSWSDADVADAGWSDADVVADAPGVGTRLLRGVKKYVADPIRDVAGLAVEPVLTIGSGLGSQVLGNLKGIAQNVAEGTYGTPEGSAVAKQRANEFARENTYEPRTPLARALLQGVGEVIDKGKLAGLPMVGNELPMLASAIRQQVPYAGAAVAQAGAIPNTVGEAAKTGAQRLMVHALKPVPKDIISGKADIAAKELLARGINPNTGGTIKIKELISDLNTRAGNLVQGAQGSVGKQQVLSGIDDTTNKFMMQAAPESDLNAIRAVADEFANHPAITGEQIPVQLAQKLKEGTYDVLRGKYGEVGSASTEAQKAIARGLRQGVEEAVPAVVPLNAEQHALLRTLDVVERRAAMDLAKDPAQLTGMLRSPAAWAAFTANKSSMFKAVVAQMLDSLGNALKSKTPVRPTGPEPLSLAPLGEQIAPAAPGFQSAPVQSRGLLGLSEGTGATSGLEMPAVDFPIQPRVGPLFNPTAERPIGPGTSSPDYFRMPEVQPQAPAVRPTIELGDLRNSRSAPLEVPQIDMQLLPLMRKHGSNKLMFEGGNPRDKITHTFNARELAAELRKGLK